MHVVKFGAPWCSQCKSTDAAFEKVKEELSTDDLYFSKVNVDDEGEQDYAARYNVRNIPAILLISEGGKYERYDGDYQYQDLKDWILSKVPKRLENG